MSDIAYSNRELDEKLSGIHEKLDLIFNQTSKTNERVSRLEAWRNYIAGGLAVISVIGLPIIGIEYYQLQTVSAQTISNQTMIEEYTKGLSALLKKNNINPQVIFNEY